MKLTKLHIGLIIFFTLINNVIQAQHFVDVKVDFGPNPPTDRRMISCTDNRMKLLVTPNYNVTTPLSIGIQLDPKEFMITAHSMNVNYAVVPISSNINAYQTVTLYI